MGALIGRRSRHEQGCIEAQWTREEETEDSKFKAIKCPKCGIMNGPESKACPHCGIPLDI
jgi:uncharacterized OB-fold protein